LNFPIILGALAAGVFGACVLLLDLSMWPEALTYKL
jgi:hypothetical protein